MKKRLTLILTVIIIFVMPIVAAAIVGNHVINGDFEEFDYIRTDWDIVLGQQDENNSTVAFVNEEDNIYAKFEANEADYISIDQSVFLQSNTNFEIGAKFMADDIKLEGTGAYIGLKEGQGQSAQVKGTLGAWQDIKFYVTTGDADIYTGVKIALGSEESPNSGVLMVDDVYIVEVDAIPVDAIHVVLSTEETTEATQKPASETIASSAPLLSESKRLAIIFLLLATVIFMFLISWLGSHSKNALEKTIFHGPWQKVTMALVFTIFILYKYYLSTFGTDLGSDLGAYIKWTESLSLQGMRYFYSNTNCIYPCGYMYVLWLVGKIAILLKVPFTTTLFKLIIKTPVIITEIITALLTYKIAKKSLGEKNATIFSFIMLINPAILINTASWGQMDAVYILAIVFVFYLLEEKRSYWAAGVFAFSLLIKTQAILFLPVFGAYYLQLFLRDKPVFENIKELLMSVLIAFATYWLVSVPFMGDEGVFWQFTQIKSTANHFGYASLNAFNFYTLFGGNYAVVNDKFIIFSYKTWGFFFIVLSSLISVILVFINRKKQALFLIAAFMLAAVFTFGHSMHERYIVPVPVLLFFAYIYIKDSRLINLGILYTVFALLSQAAVLFFFGMPFYKTIVFSMSVFSLLIFGYLVYVCYLLLFKKGTVIKSIDTQRPDEIKRKNVHAAAKIVAKIKRQPAKRLHSKRQIARINKYDRLIIIVITLVYASIAFINLGDFKIADSAWQPKVAGETVVFELDDETRVNQIKYYFGLGQTKMHITTSDDGETYYEVGGKDDEDGQLILEFGTYKVYAWQFVKVDFGAKYIKMEFTNDDVDVRELGFVGADGEVLTIKNISSNLSTSEELSPIIDEQDMIPDKTSYMSSMYFDEIYHARTALEHIEHRNVYEITHPPLGKTLISIGIRIFGMTPFGWRFMGTLVGALMLPVMYILSKRVFRRTLFASFATILFAFDFMHFAQTRIATIDSYSILFILFMFLFMYDYTSMNFNQDKLYKTLVPLGLGGLFFGLGAATKWLCLYAGAGMAAILFYTLFLRYREFEAAKLRLADGTAGKHKAYYTNVVSTFYYKLFITLFFCIITYIVIPVIIYYLSYIPYMHIKNNPYDFAMIMKNQSYMWNYHAHLKTASPHPFSSRWYTWFFDIRPVYFFQGKGYPSGTISSLSSFGNPIIWWALTPAAIIILGLKATRHKLGRGLGYSAVAGLSNIVPWIFVTRETYIYHYFACVPFVIIIITFVLKYFFEKTKHGKYLIIVYLMAVMAAFIMFYPLITGLPISTAYASAMRWLGSWPFY